MSWETTYLSTCGPVDGLPCGVVDRRQGRLPLPGLTAAEARLGSPAAAAIHRPGQGVVIWVYIVP